MKRNLTVVLLVGLLALSLATFAVQAQPECIDELGCIELGSDDPVTVGYMLTTSGATAFLGEDSIGGIELALLGRDNDFLGHELELVGEDSLCSADGGQTAAQRIAADESIVGVIGTTCSSSGEAALPIISEAGMLMISPSNTAPSLTNDDSDEGGTWQPGYYRTAHNDLFQGAIAAEFAFNELGAESLATIHDGSPYADGLQSVMADTFEEVGGEVTFQGAVNVGDTDMTAILTEIATNPPDVLYFPIFEPEGNFIAAQTADIPGLEETTLMGADGLLVASFPENTGDAAVGMFMSGPAIAGDAYDEFLEIWEEEIGGPPPSVFHAHAYDATNMLLNAAEKVAEVDDEGNISIGRQALRDAMTATEDFEGLTGVLSCGETGDCATGEALGVFQITEEELDGNWPPPLFWSPLEMMEEA